MTDRKLINNVQFLCLNALCSVIITLNYIKWKCLLVIYHNFKTNPTSSCALNSNIQHLL